MKETLWRCSHFRCRGKLTTTLSVELAVRGWACVDVQTFCPKHLPDPCPTEAETSAAVVEILRRKLFAHAR